jgi:hypothetical protein
MKHIEVVQGIGFVIEIADGTVSYDIASEL